MKNFISIFVNYNILYPETKLINEKIINAKRRIYEKYSNKRPK